MARIKKTNIHEDIALFAKVADLLESPDPPSLRQAAAELGLTDYHLRAALDRVSDHLGVERVIHTSEKMASATGLTEEGRRFHQEIRKLIDWKPSAKPQVRLAVSHSLLTSRLLAPVLRKFQEDRKCEIDLQARVSMDFGQVLRDLQTDKLDAAVVFRSDERETQLHSGIATHDFNAVPFRVVLIAGDPRQLESHTRQKDGVLTLLSNKRVATLRADRQPGVAKLPPPDRARGGERIEMDTTDAVIACVLSGVAEFGLVVAYYSVLDPLKRTGTLYYSPPLDNARLIGLTSRRANSTTRQLIRAIDSAVAGLSAERTTFLKGDAFPRDPSFYEDLRYGYYIDQPRGLDKREHGLAPAWRWEHIALDWTPPRGADPSNSASEAYLRFGGRISNLLGDEFECEAERLHDSLFHVRALKQTDSAAVEAFVSVFSWCGAEEGILFGHWTGRDAEDNETPAIYSTIWSRSPLGEARLRSITETLKSRLFLESDRFIDFDQQTESTQR